MAKNNIKKKKKRSSFSIFIFCHGDTVLDENEWVIGRTNTRLNKKGKKNAQILAKKLRDKKIGVAFHSNLLRSKQTLKEVLKYHPECKKILKNKKLLPRKMGKLKKHKLSHLKNKLGDAKLNFLLNVYDVPSPSGESIKDVQERTFEFCDFLLEFIYEKEVNVAISTHKLNFKAFRKYFEDLTIKRMLKLKNSQDKVLKYTVVV